MPINQEVDPTSLSAEASHDTRHKVSNNYEIADTDPKAFDGDSSVKQYGGVGVGYL